MSVRVIHNLFLLPSSSLSERNCVEIIMKLLDLGMLQLIYTLNNKEYVTPQRLQEDILAELKSHRGMSSFSASSPFLR